MKVAACRTSLIGIPGGSMWYPLIQACVKGSLSKPLVHFCRWLTDFRRPYAAAPDADRAPHRAAEDQLHSDSGTALFPPGKDFRPSPLGRSVVTALEAQLEKVRKGLATPALHEHRSGAG